MNLSVQSGQAHPVPRSPFPVPRSPLTPSPFLRSSPVGSSPPGSGWALEVLTLVRSVDTFRRALPVVRQPRVGVGFAVPQPRRPLLAKLSPARIQRGLVAESVLPGSQRPRKDTPHQERERRAGYSLKPRRFLPPGFPMEGKEDDASTDQQDCFAIEGKPGPAQKPAPGRGGYDERATSQEYSPFPVPTFPSPEGPRRGRGDRGIARSPGESGTQPNSFRQ